MFAFTSLLFAAGLAEFLGSPLGQLMPFVLMIAVFYFLVLRPMSNQESERKQRLAELKRGDRIVLTGGLLGRISRVEEDIVVVEIADKTKVRVLKKDVADLEDSALAKAKKDRGGDDADKKDASKKDAGKKDAGKKDAGKKDAGKDAGKDAKAG